MMNLKLIGTYVISVVMILVCPIYVFSLEGLARFQSIIPAPEPVRAGEKITFAIVALNTGKTDWPAAETEFEVEIYDEKRNYLLKTDKVRPRENVSPGVSILKFVSLNVPTSFSGKYYFRVSLTVKSKRIAYSDFLQFNVSPLEPIRPPPFEVGGNAIISYRNDSKEVWRNHIGNISLNLLGRIYERAFVFNLYTNHTRRETFELYNLIISYYGDNFDLSLGDIMPDFSILSLSNAGMKGILPVIRWKSLTTSLVAARSIEPEEGTDTTPGTYARYVYGGYKEISLPYENSIRLSFVVNSDDKNSIQRPGITTPIYNSVIALNLVSRSLKYLSLSFDYARSYHSTDTTKNTIPVEDNAYRLGIETNTGLFSFRAGYQVAGSDFNSPGSPTVVKDKITRDAAISLKFAKLCMFSLSYTDYEDNLKKNPEKITTTQRIYSSGFRVTAPEYPVLTLSYTTNEIAGKEPKEKQLLNNYTNTISAGIAYSFKSLTTFAGVQSSRFRNEVNPRTNTDTISANFGLNFQFKELLSINLGFNNTNIKDLSDSSINALNTYSITTNLKIVPGKLILTLWGNTTQRRDNDITYPADTLAQAANAEITYYINKNFGWTIGAGFSDYRDNRDISKNYLDTRVSTRLSLGF